MEPDKMHPVEQFWTTLQSCDTYPVDVVPVPEMLPGTAAFPSSAGVCRPTGSVELPDFPYGGLMIIGHSLDGVDSYHARRERGVSDGDADPGRRPATWRGIHRLLEIGGVPREDVFVTSVFVGLKAGDTGAFTRFPSQAFSDWCARFLEQQVQTMRPSVVMLLGSVAAAEIARHCDPPQRRTSRLPAPGHLRTDLFGVPTLLLTVKHPSMPGRLRADGFALADAWNSDQ